MNTHGIKANVPDTLKKHTREEQRKARELKKQQVDAAKAQKKAEAEGKKASAAKWIAAVEDKQVLEDKHIQSLRPDVNMAKHLLKLSQQSVASVLAQSKMHTSTASSLHENSANTDTIDQSPSPSPIASPNFDFASTLNNGTQVDSMSLTNGDDLLSLPGICTSKSELEGMTDDFGGSNSDTNKQVPGDRIAAADGSNDKREDPSSDEYKESDGTGSEGSGSESEAAMDIQKKFQEFLKAQKAEVKATKKKVKSEGKKKTAAERKEERLDVCRAVIAERNAVPKVSQIEVKPAAIPTKKCKEPASTISDPDPSNVESQKCSKTEVGGLAKDWRSVLASKSSALSGGDTMTATMPSVKREPGGKKKSSTEAKKIPAVVLQDEDVQEIDVKDHGNSKKLNWKNRDLPFEDFATSATISEPFGVTNHSEFKSTIQDLWKKIFSYLPPKCADSSIWAEHPAIYSVAAAAVRTYQSDIGKEALKVMERNWEREEMKGYTTEEERSAWVKQQLNGSWFLYKAPQEKVTVNAPYHYGNPVAGLAVAGSAVKRALTMWKEGSKTQGGTETNSRNNENSFKDDPWGTVANKYHSHLAGYDDDKWREIILDSAKYLNAKKNKLILGRGLSSVSSDGIVDGDDDITQSP
ncbi:hypothetical protein ARMGADRAFT_1039641 [Armillaria gallica]|uniref:Uncharacterized protein n=1 Tax=Armillaria gallica TaxID=47427 RepID=A0A2H3CCZ4_ARMGA|nr:hypothetical protein ARMGADRAFT_1039641 [Armillaria gallica]